MVNETISSTFKGIQNELLLENYLSEVCTFIIDGTINKDKINKILYENDINKDIAKFEFLKLILEYIKRALKDDILTITERENIKFLKIWFGIKPGDFYLHCREDIEKIIQFQLYKIYKDNLVTDEEALLKVDLQEVFEMTFDQMNEFAKVEAAISIKQGASINSLDVFFANKEYFKLKSN